MDIYGIYGSMRTYITIDVRSTAADPGKKRKTVYTRGDPKVWRIQAAILFNHVFHSRCCCLSVCLCLFRYVFVCSSHGMEVCMCRFNIGPPMLAGPFCRLLW